jgi:hypothetical protein
MPTMAEVTTMTTATKKVVLGDFTVEYLGCEYPDYFQGYGVAFSRYDNCAYGIGDTIAEALDDCIEMFAQSSDIDCTEEVEARIRADFGEYDADATVSDVLGIDENEDNDGCGESAYFHVGIKWNEIAE